MSDTTIDQDRIEEDLRATRSRMDRRLNELQGKLAPGQIFEDLLDYVRGNGGAEFGNKLLDSVQKNPLPAVVAGVGLAWLMASDFRPAPRVVTAPATNNAYTYGSGWDDDLHQRLSAAEAGVRRDPDDTDDSYASRLDDARAKVLGVARQAQDTATSFAQRVQAAISSAKESATRNSHDLRDRAAGAAGQASDAAQQIGGRLSGSAQQVGGQIRDSAQQLSGQIAQGAKAAQQSGGDMIATLTANPLALGALGLAAGALLGVLLPHTQQEEAALGGIASQARDTVRTAAQTVIDQGSTVAQQVMDKAKESAATHGFTTDKSLNDVAGDIKSGDLVDNVKNVAQDILSAGEQALKKGGQASDQT